jgi:hypothetical protein
MQPPRLQGTDPGYLAQTERGTRSAQASGRVRRGSPHLGLGSTRCKRTKFVVAAKARSTSPPVPSTRRGSYPEAEPPPLALGRGASSRSRPQDLGRVPRESAASQTPSNKTWCSLFEACQWPSFAGGPASHDLPRQHLLDWTEDTPHTIDSRAAPAIGERTRRTRSTREQNR